LRYRKLGTTDLTLSELGFGAWTVATNWWGKIEPDDGVKLLWKAADLGITFFDTADAYADGFGETIVAQALNSRRHQLVYGTKVGYDIYTPQPRVGHAERPQRWDTAFIRHACEQSLRRLRTDYIDVYQVHNPKMDAINNDELFGTLSALVKEGKIRYFAAAIGPDLGWLDEGLAVMEKRPIAAMQIIYNILEQQPARKFFAPARDKNVGLMSRVPHASDVLTSKFAVSPPVFSATDHRSHRRQQWLLQAMKKRTLVEFLERDGHMTLAQAAIRFCLTEPNIASVLPNITSEADLTEYVGASEVADISPDIASRLWDVYDTGFGLVPEPSGAGAA